MMPHRVSDWDNAYANGANIAGGDRWPGLWVEPATAFRKARVEAGRAELDVTYGDAERNRLDLFLPDRDVSGLVVFIHGGFWLKLDKSFWSHLAAGPLAHGYAVAMPSYTLCPDIRISGIVAEIGVAIEKAASIVDGPIRLTGHSAGGHLATRMITITSPLREEVRARIARTVSISGVHDLRPMMKTAMNADLKIDQAEAITESPALLSPTDGARVTCWVGGTERAEFRRQNALLANIWTGLGAATACNEEPDRHHFDIIDGLADPDHPLTRCLLTD
ncbi:alpha/beta hydrolase [Aliihoeflea sp. PC F10.4]